MVDDNGPIWREYIVNDMLGQEVYRVTLFNDLRPKGAGDGLIWDHAGAGAPYTIYCREQGAEGFGYIGMSAVCGFVNDRWAPDYSAPPHPVASPKSWLQRLMFT